MLKVESFALGPLETNAYLLLDPESNKAVIIDPGMNPERLIERIKDMDVEAILLTHAHFDHIGGVDVIRKLKNCPVYLHAAEADWLTVPEYNGSARWVDITPPIITEPAEHALQDGQTLQLLGEEIQVYHTPGHSPGSVSFLWGSHLFGGDVLFQRSVGRTDLPGGSQRELYESIHNVLFRMDPSTIVYPGHGPSTTIGFEQEHNPFV